MWRSESKNFCEYLEPFLGAQKLCSDNNIFFLCEDCWDWSWSIVGETEHWCPHCPGPHQEWWGWRGGHETDLWHVWEAGGVWLGDLLRQLRGQHQHSVRALHQRRPGVTSEDWEQEAETGETSETQDSETVSSDHKVWQEQCVWSESLVRGPGADEWSDCESDWHSEDENQTSQPSCDNSPVFRGIIIISSLLCWHSTHLSLENQSHWSISSVQSSINSELSQVSLFNPPLPIFSNYKWSWQGPNEVRTQSQWSYFRMSD